MNEFKCKAIENTAKDPKDPNSSFRDEAQAALNSQTTYHLIACVKLHFDIPDKWKSGLLALALQHVGKIHSFVPIGEGAGFRAAFNEHNIREINQDKVDQIWNQMKDNTLEDTALWNTAYDYWANYDKEKGTSTAVGNLNWFGGVPKIEEIEARFKAALYKWHEDKTVIWDIIKGDEVIAHFNKDED